MWKIEHVKRLLLCLLCTMVFAMGRADSTIGLSSASGVPGAEVDVCVSLSGTEPTAGMQLSVPLSPHLTYVEGSAVLAAERADGHRVMASEVEGCLRVIVFSLTGKPLRGTEGALLTFRLRLGTEPGIYPLLPDVTLSGSGTESVSCHVQQSGAVTIMAPRLDLDTEALDFGHVPIRDTYTRPVTVRNAGTTALLVSGVTFSDASLTVDAPAFTLAAGATRELIVTYAPVARGTLEATMGFVTDAVGGEQTVAITADAYAVNELHTSHALAVSDTEVEIVLTMNNMDPITGVQCAYQLPEALTYVEGSARLSDRSNGHRISATAADGRLVLAIYSMTKQPLTGCEGEIARFRLLPTAGSGTFPLHPTDVTLGVAEGHNVVSAAYAGSVEIAAPHLQCDERFLLPEASVTAAATAAFPLSNTSSLPLVVSDVRFADAGYAVDDVLPLTIPAESSYDLHLQYVGSEAGAFGTTMRIYTNDPDQRMVTVELSGQLYEPNTLHLVHQGEGSVAVELNNYSRITGLQADLRLEGAHATALDVELGERLRGFSHTLRPVAPDTWRLVLFAFRSGTSIADHDGTLLRIVCQGLSVDDTAEGESRIVLENVVLSGPEARNYLTPGSLLSCALSPSPGMLGDVNGDGRVTVADVALLIDLLSRPVFTDAERQCGDIDGNGILDAADVTALADLVIR